MYSCNQYGVCNYLTLQTCPILIITFASGGRSEIIGKSIWLSCESDILDRYIDADSGTRSDVPHHYIYNLKDDKNLHIFTSTRVVRVIFE